MSDREEFWPAQGPTRYWRIRGWTVSRYRRRDTHMRGLWGATYGGRGVEGYRTPVGAFLALRRWLREPVNPR